ncbi:MAG: response regulator transcription factor [Chloroflexi bacterium]|nr:response regulator transcription factor [Chloroflexota bacterium]
MSREEKMRVLLADDQMRVRSALRLLLEQEPGFQVVGEAADATGLLLAATEKAPDLLLLDWELPGLPAAQLLRLLKGGTAVVKNYRYEQPPRSSAAGSRCRRSRFLSKVNRQSRCCLPCPTVKRIKAAMRLTIFDTIA